MPTSIDVAAQHERFRGAIKPKRPSVSDTTSPWGQAVTPTASEAAPAAPELTPSRPLYDGKLAELYALGAPIEGREDQEDGVHLRARLPHREVRRFARFLIAEAHVEPVRRAR